ncbi:MAG: biopolymer transporter ExbD [Deltaproteobacteria bacterium]|nr:biopolymer transporter ExbD [Deltaproteobacteria bacterium]
MNVDKLKSSVRSEINVTPLVDVVLVLLIIFMVVTPLLEKELNVRVPELETEPTPPEDLPQDNVVVQLQNGRLYVNQQELPKEALLDRVTQMNAARKDKIVFFDAEDVALYGDAVWVLDTLKRAGTETIGMMLPEPPR